ncbi:MAG: response regulator [Anaerolineae bacterium]
MLDQKRVLIVDDSFSIRRLMRSLLARQGAHPEEASTGQETLKLLDSGQQYDLILLDLLLPDMSGLQVLQCIRERSCECAVVILTAFADVKTALEAVRHGADGYIQKQELAVGGDYGPLFYALEQALQHRLGLLAQEQLDRVKSEFYSMVTHDLRNPVAQILGIVELLLEMEPLTPAQRELLSLAQTAAHRLLELANDYLDFAQIDTGYLRLDLGPAELGEIVRSSAALAEVQARARQQALHLELPSAPVPAWIDARRIGQVVDNLLDLAGFLREVIRD